MFRYLIIESVDDISTYQTTLISFFTDIMHIDQIKLFDQHMVIYFHGETALNFSDIIINLSADILSDLRLFESYHFKTINERDNHLEHIFELLQKIAIPKHTYLNEQLILKTLIHRLDKSYHPCFLKAYAYDAVMLGSVRVYLESNQNTSYAAKQLFIHRNTLIQRIDKFIDVTGFDIREFVPGYLIYSLLTT